MPSFSGNLGTQKDKKGLRSNQDTKKSLGTIKFISECTMIELCNNNDEYLLIDDIIPLKFNYFFIDDGILEYIGDHGIFRTTQVK